jgi:hypothetical protein
MAVVSKKLQPGAILHEVIVGCLRSSGTNFDAWCRDNKINTSTARQATYGQSGGDSGKKLLNRMIDSAGREQVEMSYRTRIERHALEIKNGEAA